MLTFLGAAQTVTGSKSLVETGSGRVLVDCGLFQGPKKLRLQNWDPFPIAPESIDAVVLTHAHVDHSGYLPRLCQLGFKGPIFCTEGTERLSRIVLPDSGHLQEEEAAYANRLGYSKHDPALPLYTRADATDCLEQFESVTFDSTQSVVPGIDATWRRAGHILGAASIGLQFSDSDTSAIFSGDLGHSTHPLLLPPAPIGQADTVVVESTYGDESHDDDDPADLIAEVINEAARRGGVIIIPAFAVDRTEVVLWHLNRLVAEERVPDIPVFVDSPMACRALDVYRDETLSRSPEIRPELRGQHLFSSIDVQEVHTADESRGLNARRGPFIVISASGMATGGRVIHHLAHRLGDDRNTVLLVGFQAPNTRGDRLRRGERRLKLLGRYYPVAARVAAVGLSAHADSSDLVDWVGTNTSTDPTVFVNHGEPEASSALIEALEQGLGIEAIAPQPGERVRLDAR